jgi:hypothetical protein
MPAFLVTSLSMFLACSTSWPGIRGRLMARRGVFVRAEEVAFLDEAACWRQRCIEVLSRAKPQGPLYKATEGIVDAIDGLAEVVTGDRKRFHQASPRTPGPDLPPVKWRTVD